MAALQASPPRRPRALRLLLVAALAARALAAAPAAADAATDLLAALSEDERQKLSDERVMLVENPADAKEVKALVLFEPPPDQVMGLIRQTVRQVEYRPELKGCDTVKTFPDGLIEEQRMKIAFVKMTFYLRHTIDEEGRALSWRLAEGYDSAGEEVAGYWRFHGLSSGGTLAEFGTRVDVGAMPGFLQDYVTRKNVPKTLDRTRQWVDSGGTWRP